jgi:hypothetical protein
MTLHEVLITKNTILCAIYFQQTLKPTTVDNPCQAIQHDAFLSRTKEISEYRVSMNAWVARCEAVFKRRER